MVFLFYALVAPVVAGAGAVGKGTTSIAPVVIIGAMANLASLNVRRVFVASVVAALVVLPLTSLPTVTPSTVASDNTTGQKAAALLPSLVSEQRCLGKPLVLMTRNPWEITQATGFRTVQIPNDSLSEILSVAREYHMTDIELSSARAALHDVKALTDLAGPLAQSPELAPQDCASIGLRWRRRRHCTDGG